ncbi:Hypothetical protein I596_1773 [Dokdonella koreensis DS-123]|uniref:Uncharacterized protein n=1 Tax=Dokdonella koreensis DS-123 TaxID=1300342 RepID=A0A160DTS4_9GAMM|nr:Hypothetical protein I596_1773 [Dokdonella koreensis DS-123]
MAVLTVPAPAPRARPAPPPAFARHRGRGAAADCVGVGRWRSATPSGEPCCTHVPHCADPKPRPMMGG